MGREWLNELKEGDKVFVFTGSFLRKGYVFKITKTMICVKTLKREKKDESMYRFKKTNGVEVGGGKWSQACLYEFNNENKFSYNLQVINIKVKKMIDNIEIKHNDIEYLEKLIEVLKPFQKEGVEK